MLAANSSADLSVSVLVAMALSSVIVASASASAGGQSPFAAVSGFGSYFSEVDASAVVSVEGGGDKAAINCQAVAIEVVQPRWQ